MMTLSHSWTSCLFRKAILLSFQKKRSIIIFDLEDDMLSELMLFAKHVARKMDKVFDCDRIGVSVIGLEVPHTHVHLVPISNVGDINFAKEKTLFPLIE